MSVLSSGRSDVVGEPHYGYIGLAGPSHGIAHGRPIAAQTVWPYQAVDIAHYDEEHYRPGRVSADGHFLPAVRWWQDVGHTDGPWRRVRFRAHPTLHSHLQHVRHDDAVQRDQRAQDPWPAQRVPRILHQPDILQHLDWHHAVPGVHHPVRQGRIQHQEPLTRTMDVVPVIWFRHFGVGTDRHHRAHSQNPETSIVSINLGKIIQFCFVYCVCRYINSTRFSISNWLTVLALQPPICKNNITNRRVDNIGFIYRKCFGEKS